MHPQSTMYDLVCHAAPLCLPQTELDVGCEKWSESFRNANQRRSRGENSPKKTTVVKMRACTPSTTTTLTKNVLAEMQIPSHFQSISTPDTTSTTGFKVTSVRSTVFCLRCLENSHRRAECSFCLRHLQQRLLAQLKNYIIDLPSNWQTKFEYQSAYDLKCRPAKVPAQHESLRDILLLPPQSAKDL